MGSCSTRPLSGAKASRRASASRAPSSAQSHQYSRINSGSAISFASLRSLSRHPNRRRHGGKRRGREGRAPVARLARDGAQALEWPRRCLAEAVARRRPRVRPNSRLSNPAALRRDGRGQALALNSPISSVEGSDAQFEDMMLGPIRAPRRPVPWTEAARSTNEPAEVRQQTENFGPMALLKLFGGVEDSSSANLRSPAASSA